MSEANSDTSNKLCAAKYIFKTKEGEFEHFYFKRNGKLCMLLTRDGTNTRGQEMHMTMLTEHDLQSGETDTTSIINGKILRLTHSDTAIFSDLRENPGEVNFSNPGNGFYKPAVITREGEVIYRLKFDTRYDNIHSLATIYPEIPYLLVDIKSEKGTETLVEVYRDQAKVDALLAPFMSETNEKVDMDFIRDTGAMDTILQFCKNLVSLKRSG